MKKFISLILCFIFVFSFGVTAFAVDVKTVTENENVEVLKNVITAEEQKKLDSLPVKIKAKAVVLMEVTTGRVLLEYAPHKKLFPASVTKVMTMLLTAEAINSKRITLADKVTCSANAASKGGSQIWLEEGESMTVDELLRATAIGSANDAATLLGEYVAGSETAFIDMMNTRAKELKMNNTHFENATGLDDATDTHLTTAMDIAIMSAELLKYDFIKDYTTVWMDSLRNGKTELVNTNKLVRFYSGTTGLKTGTTAKAGCCISASAKRDGLHLVAVVMGSDSSADRFETAKAMLDWGFSNFTAVTPKISRSSMNAVEVVGGKEDTVPLNVPNILPVIIEKGQESQIKVSVNKKSSLEAPVKAGDKAGSIKIEIPGQDDIIYVLKAEKDVEKLTFYDCILRIFNFIAQGKK